MDDNRIDQLEQKLEKLVRLSALQAIDNKPRSEQFRLLSQASFQPREIAELVGTTANTVRVELSRARKRDVREAPNRKRGDR